MDDKKLYHDFVCFLFALDQEISINQKEDKFVEHRLFNLCKRQKVDPIIVLETMINNTALRKKYPQWRR